MASILIDSRLGSRDLFHHITPKSLAQLSHGIATDIAFLGHGPHKFKDRIGIEYKKLQDALQCMKDGRLVATQLVGMKENFEHYWLLIEGVWKHDPDDALLKIYRSDMGGWVDTQQLGWSKAPTVASDFEHWLFSLQIITGLRLQLTGKISDSGRWITSLYHWWQKPWDDHKSVKVFDYSGPSFFEPDASLQRRVAKELPHIGWEMSAVCEERWASAREMVNAPASEWAELVVGREGKKKRRLGVKYAREIDQALDGEEGAEK